MSSQPLNLVERAAERLRQSGSLDAATAPLLGGDPAVVHALASTAEPLPLPPRRPAADVARTAPAIPISILERAGMIDWTKGRSRVSEEFRIIQGQIMRSAFAAPVAGQGLSNLVMVTSARPGEGKSFASLNLALSIARQRDHAVLLVDTSDSKDQSIGNMLGLVNTPGLLDLALDARLDPDDVIATTEHEKLSVLSLGSKPEKSAELFATRQMTRLIRDLGRRYADRVVILDAAPCLSSSDPSTLAPIVGQIVMVVEAERTQRSEVEAALDLVQACPTISLMLNKVQVTTSYTFGAYPSANYSTS